MRQVKKIKTIHYKKVVLTNNSATLQELLEKALEKNGKANKAISRRELINQDDDSYRLINHHKIFNGMLFGQLIFFEAGTSQPLITIDEEAEILEINAISPQSVMEEPNDDSSRTEVNNKKREFIDSILYFGASDNDLVIMQSSALSARHLETHLSWLLGTCTELVEKNTALILQDKPSNQVLDRIEKSPVKSVHLGTPIESVAEQDDFNEISPEQLQPKKVKWHPKGMGADLVKAALGTDWLNKLNLNESLDEANLQVSLEITYFRKTSESGQKILDNIATNLRHIDEADVSIDLHGGGQIRGKDLKLSGKISVNTINGLIDENDLYNQMHSWVVTKINSNDIEVDSD